MTTQDIPVTFEPYIGKPDKSRLIAVLRGEKTDRVPNMEILIEDAHVEKILARKAGNTLGVGGEPAKGSQASESVIRPMYPNDYIELCRVIGQDAIILENLWTPIKRKNSDGTIELWNDKSLKNKEQANQIIWPGQEDIDKNVRYIREYVQAAERTDIGVVFLCGCIWQTLYEFVLGFEDAMVMSMAEPDFVGELLSKSADYYEKLINCAIDEGIDVLFLADDFAFNKGLFMRPDRFEPLWRPHFERLTQPARNANVPIIFHSDGKVDDAVEMLIDMGINCLNPMDTSGVDYRDYKKKYGHRVTLWGNIDIQSPLVQGTPEDVRKDVKDHMQALKPGGRWIAGSSHSIVNYIPHENFVTMINAFHEYGKY
jgi:uroporphyrinogen-III decarboxylase